jgi:protein-S-isoprenylcysteine O-methyltransferase Ste14
MKSRRFSPTRFNLFLVLAIGLHFVLPIKKIIYAPYTYSGIIFILLGGVLNIWSVALLKKNGTTVDFHGTPNELMINGPFRISRNPIYLSGVILSLGLAILLGSLITFVFPVALLIILNYLYIPSEEVTLGQVFGEEFLQYKQKVRRWI